MKVGVKKEHFRRAGWLFLALLFIVTGLGVGIYAFWVNTHPANNTANNNPGSSTVNKLQGTKLSGFTPTASIATLQTIDQKVGTGAEATPSSTVTVNYTGAVAATGLIFQSSLDSGQPVAFPLSQVIKGWTEGIPGMKVGGTRRLLIPAALGYGANSPPNSGIPPNADLVFDVQLLKVQ